MDCPKCGRKMIIKDVRERAENVIYRRRVCVRCGYAYVTNEYDQTALEKVCAVQRKKAKRDLAQKIIEIMKEEINAADRPG